MLAGMNASKTTATPPAAPANFEAALAQLEDLVQRLETGSLPLAETVGAVANGQKLIDYCRAQLAQAETALVKLNPATGQPTTEA
jgi:exodeoxyribonuclease VII small subunit